MKEFKELGISERNIYPLIKKGFKEPTEIQKLTIPLLINDDVDVIAQAQTGTGKTAAFGLPLIEKIRKNGSIQALILAPTRELCIQVCDEINSLKGDKNINIIPIYGGQSIEVQFKKLKRGASIVVGTPGRILDHLKRGTLEVGKIKYFILDEADEMLNMGFIDDIETIFSYTPKNKRVLLFSATMPQRIKKLVERYMSKYKFIKVGNQITTDLTEQIYYEIDENDKIEALSRIIDSYKNFYGLIFCQTKVEVNEVAGRLIERGYSAEPLHGDLSQAQREKTLSKFRKGIINILVATDVAARGIDIVDLTHVINYSVPQNPEIYIHRIGRTGRAGKKGLSITFVNYKEIGKFEIIKRVSNSKIKKETLPEVKEIFKSKKREITENILKNLDISNDFFDKWAEELMEESSPKELISAILKSAYSKDFNEKFYKNLNKKFNKNSEKVRLFISKGKSDNFTKRKIVDFITQNSGVDSNDIEDIKIFENFSFITVPDVKAQVILYNFKNIKNGKRPVVEKAKPFRKKIKTY